METLQDKIQRVVKRGSGRGAIRCCLPPECRNYDGFDGDDEDDFTLLQSSVIIDLADFAMSQNHVIIPSKPS